MNPAEHSETAEVPAVSAVKDQFAAAAVGSEGSVEARTLEVVGFEAYSAVGIEAL